MIQHNGLNLRYNQVIGMEHDETLSGDGSNQSPLGVMWSSLPNDVVKSADIADMATTGDIDSLVTSIAETYQTTAGMTAYQSAGDYLSANALDSVSGDWNRISALTGYSASGWSVSPTAGKQVFAGKVLFSPQAGQNLNAYLGVYSPGASTAGDVYTYITDGGSIYLYNKNRSPSAQYIRPDTIVKWNNYASGKLNTTATANFYTTANESGFITGVPAGTMNESAFGYDGSNVITSYNGSAFAQGGGSTPAYEYTDNGLISAIDTSGLYASSGSANHLILGGTMGKNIKQSDGANNFLYMPTASPFGKPTGIFSPLQYATGACLAMDGGNFAAYFKGNEWYVCNTGIGQALRGEVHQSRGVHLSGATTAGYGFNLGILSVSGVNSTGSWKYGHAEDAAVRTVSSKLDTSAFTLSALNDASANNIVLTASLPATPDANTLYLIPET